MREIKFRGIKLNSDEFVYGWLWRSPDGRTWIKSFETRKDCPVDKKTVCQYKGLKDKSGKEIFEGDILIDDCNELHEVKFGKLTLRKSGDCVCTYEAFYCKCYGKLGSSPMYECTEIGNWMIIKGNIHETPEVISQ